MSSKGNGVTEMEENEKQTVDSLYIQQHLANERTYLAWIRTSIAIMGVGFFATSLHFSTPLSNYYDEFMAILISVIAFVIGVVIISISTYIYLKNRKTINTGEYYSSNIAIIFTSILMTLILALLLTYFLTFN
ncbi:YidH family protein [Alteribacillus sp. JSM 102045]|uniref:YidH family protein n=1 Tax=Alteribacillus sp. JSM 102045 TaxID=1562101 RepID=UPI0035C0FBFF